MPDAPPKLPSIWNGGCASNMLGNVRSGVSRFDNRRNVCGPSSSLAQRFTFHARLQPVPPSPRNSSDFLAAAHSSGVPWGVISLPGQRPQRCERWRCWFFGLSLSSSHSLKLPKPADLVRCDPRPGLGQFAAERFVDAQNFRGLDTAREQLADDLVVHRRPGHQPAVLGRVRRRADEPTGLGILDEKIEEKRGRPFDHGIRPLGEKFAVARVEVVLPEMAAKPRPAGRPDPVVRVVRRCGATPDVRVVVQHPAAATVVHLGRLSTGRDQVVEHIKQGFGTFGQVADFGRPVVHFEVDVRGPAAAPRRPQAVVPDALQVGRLRTGPAAGDQQVAAELEIKRRQLRVAASGKSLDPFVGRQLGSVTGAQIERYPAKQPLMVGQVVAVNLGVALGNRAIELLATARGRIAADVVVVLVARCRGQEQRGRVGAGPLPSRRRKRRAGRPSKTAAKRASKRTTPSLPSLKCHGSTSLATRPRSASWPSATATVSASA